MLGGEQLGAYCLSEPQAGSDVSAISTRATPEADGSAYRLKGTKAWISHAGHADFYTAFVRTGEHPSKGLSCFVVPADTDGISFGAPERKMGLHLRHGAPGAASTARWSTPAGWSASRGRACRSPCPRWTPDGSASPPRPPGSPRRRSTSRRRTARSGSSSAGPISEFQGLSFLLADMEAAVTSARATYLHAARLKDAGRPFSKQAAVAKLVCTDAAMKVTTDAVQVLGGYGYTQDFPVERYMREAKVTQIFEGTNQIQRLVIARQLLRG